MNFNTKANRKLQFQRGAQDARKRGTVFGASNELGTLDPVLDACYRRGWKKWRSEYNIGPYVVISTDNRQRELLFYSDLKPKERAELDYVKEDTNSFFRFKNYPYDAGEFFRIIPPEMLKTDHDPMAMRDYNGWFDDWDAYQSDSHSSGVVIRYPRDDEGDIDPERIIVGNFYTKG